VGRTEAGWWLVDCCSDSTVDRLCMTSKDVKPRGDCEAIRGRLGGVEPQASFRIVPVPRLLLNSALPLRPNRSR
jgi:hypothetical protein